MSGLDSQRRWGRQEGVKTTCCHHDGDTTPFPRGVDGDQSGCDTTRAAIHVGPRRAEGCLGGNDDGAGGVDEGVENISIPLRKRGRLASSEMGTFNGFTVFSGKEDSCFLEILKF